MSSTPTYLSRSLATPPCKSTTVTTSSKLLPSILLPNHSIESNTPNSNNYDNRTQQVLTQPIDNIPFGDLYHSPKATSNLRLFLQNINGLRSYQSWQPWKQAGQALHENEVDIFGVTKTNIAWNITHQATARQIIQQQYKSAIISTSSSIDKSRTDYQPGVTATFVTNKWTGRHTSIIRDTSGMGRWSGTKLRQNDNKHLNILTVYRPTIGDGINTCYQQHFPIMRNQGVSKPDPRKQLLTDLAKEITAWNNEGDTTIVMIDANESIHTSTSPLPSFLANTKLPHFFNYHNTTQQPTYWEPNASILYSDHLASYHMYVNPA
jgi:hypothetical protein